VSGELLAVIPARGGSKALPRKALQPLAGLPLIAHSILLAQSCPGVHVVVTTDSREIAEVARANGADVPFMRPSDLAADETPMWPVVRHALAEMGGSRAYDAVLLLDPTSPARLPEDVAGARAALAHRRGVDGVIGVSEPHFNPMWVGVIERDGLLEPLSAEAGHYGRRQDVPRVLRINGSLYIWPAQYVEARTGDQWLGGRYAAWEIPERRAIHIDTVEDLELAELLIREGVVRLPWLE
jgi:CMP-N-acetylneuraminic acid synthetase